MRPITVFGLILLALGILALAWQGMIYATHTAETGQPEPVALILSIVAVVVGFIFALVGGRRRTTGSR
jgi:hypothetical protein